MSDAGTRIRFLCDEDFRGAIVRGLRRSEPQMDIQTAAEAGTMGLGDPLVLAHAAAQGRILLNHDKRTMPRHFGAFRGAGHHSPGVILLPQELPIGQAIQDIVLIWTASWAEEYQDLMIRLPLYRLNACWSRAQRFALMRKINRARYHAPDRGGGGDA